MKVQASLSTVLSSLHRYIREQQPVPLDVLTWTSGADPNVEIRLPKGKVERTLHCLAPHPHCNQSGRDEIMDSLHPHKSRASRRGETRHTITRRNRESFMASWTNQLRTSNLSMWRKKIRPMLLTTPQHTTISLTPTTISLTPTPAVKRGIDSTNFRFNTNFTQISTNFRPDVVKIQLSSNCYTITCSFLNE